MSTTATKTRRIVSPLLDREAKIAARKRVIGMWKGREGEMIKEVERGRKEWDKKADGLHRECERLRKKQSY